LKAWPLLRIRCNKEWLAAANKNVTRNRKQIHFGGKNLLVWKKEADGSWKIFRYMYDEIPAKK